MPARFVELAVPLNLAERKAGALSLFSSVGVGQFTSFNFTSGRLGGGPNGSTDPSFAFDVRAPEGAARALLLTACALWVLRLALLRSATHRALSLYGHAHVE